MENDPVRKARRGKLRFWISRTGKFVNRNVPAREARRGKCDAEYPAKGKILKDAAREARRSTTTTMGDRGWEKGSPSGFYIRLDGALPEAQRPTSALRQPHPYIYRMQYDTIRYITIHYNTIQYETKRNDAIQSDTI